jgi:transcriptional regulator with XRE-family HTH domain
MPVETISEKMTQEKTTEKTTAKEVMTSPAAPIAVDPEVVESLIQDTKIGARIKRLRLRRSMGLVELGKQAGLSASFLSQLETGRVVPTLRNLARIAMIFGKDLSYFFQADADALFRISRSKNRAKLPQGERDNPTHIAESFGILVPNDTLRPCLAEFLPASRTEKFRPLVFVGSEIIIVVAGSIDVQYGDTLHTLDEGDAAYLDARTSRTICCANDEPAKALIITSKHRQPLRNDGPDGQRGKLRSALIADFTRAQAEAPENGRL